jgi:hypothetical protein
MTQASGELAFADGARLAGCLDLLRVPATELWVEWSDEVHQRVIHDADSTRDFDFASAGRSVGVLLRGSADGLRSVARTFWANAKGNEPDVTLSPVETHFDLRGQFAPPAGIERALWGEFAALSDTDDEAVSTLLAHVRFRFDAAWAAYYRAAAVDAETRRRLVHTSLGAVARDAPMLLAFFLLLSANHATRPVAVSRAAINRKRRTHGRAALLDHIEVHASLDAEPAAAARTESGGMRRARRLHHVRGHLVRRGDRVFWRMPHLRGKASFGRVRSRTVCLSFAA